MLLNVSRTNCTKVVVVPFALILLLILLIMISDHKQINNISSSISSRFGGSNSHFQTIMKKMGMDGPNIVTENDLPKIIPYSCMRSKIVTTVHNTSWLVCAKNNYEYISQTIVSTGIWDGGSSILILDMLKNYPEAAYLDIGCNLGAFVTMGAQQGHRVYAVEPLAYNLAFTSTSLKLGRNEDKVVLINNAVSDQKIEMFPWQNNPNNEGYTILLDKETALKKPKKEILEPVRSVTLHQVLNYISESTIVFKLDVEGAECKVLMEYLYTENKTKFIPYIYMEWIHIHNNLNGMCPDSNKLIQGFIKSGYKAQGKGPKGYVDVDPAGALIDCIWIHKDAKPLIAN